MRAGPRCAGTSRRTSAVCSPSPPAPSTRTGRPRRRWGSSTLPTRRRGASRCSSGRTCARRSRPSSTWCWSTSSRTRARFSWRCSCALARAPARRVGRRPQAGDLRLSRGRPRAHGRGDARARGRPGRRDAADELALAARARAVRQRTVWRRLRGPGHRPRPGRARAEPARGRAGVSRARELGAREHEQGRRRQGPRRADRVPAEGAQQAADLRPARGSDPPGGAARRRRASSPEQRLRRSGCRARRPRGAVRAGPARAAARRPSARSLSPATGCCSTPAIRSPQPRSATCSGWRPRAAATPSGLRAGVAARGFGGEPPVPLLREQAAEVAGLTPLEALRLAAEITGAWQLASRRESPRAAVREPRGALCLRGRRRRGGPPRRRTVVPRSPRPPPGFAGFRGGRTSCPCRAPTACASRRGTAPGARVAGGRAVRSRRAARSAVLRGRGRGAGRL